MLAIAVVMLLVPWLLAPARDGETAFASDRERRLWLLVLVVLAAIYSTLGSAQLLAAMLRERNLLRVSILAVLAAVGAVALLRFVRRRPGRIEVGAAVGITAAYVMTSIRVSSWEERTHLFEYGLVALLIHAALGERRRGGKRVPVPALLALVATALLGWIDEGIQSLLPNRVYDLRDVGFNALAGLMAIASLELMALARRGVGWWRGRQRRV